jgi:diguanylate cyclase (GGDEF)-like protein
MSLTIIESAVFLLLIALALVCAFWAGRVLERRAYSPVRPDGGKFGHPAFGEARRRALEALGAGIVVLDNLGASASAEACMLLGAVEGDPELARSLRARPELAPLLAGGSGEAELSLGEGAGARRVEARVFPLDAAHPNRGTVLVLTDVTETAALVEELSALASQDALTGACNRRRFGELGERDIELARRSRSEIGALMLDIDFFKRVNDEHGHAIGDELLKAVVCVSREALRSSDVLCRYGGEEFAVLLPGTGGEECLVVAERLRTHIAAIAIPGARGTVSVTVSLGAYSGAPKAGEDLALYLRRADEALYRSKALGRNKSSYWKPLGEES